jgi:spore germination protein YaaH
MFNLWFLLCFLSLVAGSGQTAPAPLSPLGLAPQLICPAPILQRAAIAREESAMPDLVPAQPAAQGNRDYGVAIWATYAGFLEQQTLAEYAGVIDEVNFARYTLVSGGKIEGGLENERGLQVAREAGLRVVPSIANTGFTRDVVLEAIGDPLARTQHVADLVALVEEHDYAGLDIDYESLAAEDREVFSLFIEELAAALHANGRILSIAVHAKTDDAGIWGGPAAQDWPRLGAAVDEFKIMTYDYHWSTSEAGPIAPLPWVDQVLAYAATVVPPQKTWVGVHFYGYDWVGSAAESLEWQGVMKRLARSGAQVQRSEPGEAWFTYDDGRRIVYYTDALALTERLDFIFTRYPDVAGIAIWRLGGEDPANWPAIRSTVQ